MPAAPSPSEDSPAHALPAARRYTSNMTEGRVYRVTVRGRFFELDDDVRARLSHAVEDHDITKSAYTPEGTFVYDKNIYSRPTKQQTSRAPLGFARLSSSCGRSTSAIVT